MSTKTSIGAGFLSRLFNFQPVFFFYFESVLITFDWLEKSLDRKPAPIEVNNDHVNRLLACLHYQNKSAFFGGLAFIQPIRAIKQHSKSSDWLDKSWPPKKATLVLIM